jgi:Transcription factor WhiB
MTSVGGLTVPGDRLCDEATDMNMNTQPIWLHGGDQDDDSFRYDDRRMCLHHRDLYYSYEPEDLAHARDLCFRCPVFRQCVRWGLSHYEEIPHGMMFGCTEIKRRHFSEGLEMFNDWRRDWSRAKYVATITRAYDRKLRRQGTSKRKQNRREIPACPYGHDSSLVRRAGREDDRQTYRCRECGASFLGEEL